MPRRRFTLTGLFLLVAFCALLLAFFVPLMRRAAGNAQGASRVEALAFSADGSTVAALFGDGKVRIWRAETQTPLAALETAASGFGGRLAISADGKILAVSTGVGPSAKSEIEIWDAANAQKRAILPGSWNVQIVFSPIRSTLAVHRLLAPIEFYDCAPDGPPAPSSANAAIAAAMQSGGSTAMAFSDDGETLAAASATGVRFWIVKDGESGASIADRFGLIAGMALSADGAKLAVAGYDSTGAGRPKPGAYLRLWDVHNGRRLADLPDNRSTDVSSLAFLPEGRTLVRADGNLVAWDVVTGRIRTLPVDVDASATMLAAPRRGNRFAVSDSEKITLWDAATIAPREMLWTAPSEGPSPLLPAAAFALFVAWAVHRAKTLKRKCPACGASFTLASAKDAQTQCPECRLKALPVEQRAKQQTEQSKQIRNGWIGLLALLLLISAPLATFFSERLGVRPWLFAYLLAVASIALGVPGALIGFLLAKLNLRRRWLAREKNLLRFVERFGGPPAETLRLGPVLVWCADGTTLGREIERELTICSRRIEAVVGQPPSLARGLRCLIFSRHEHCIQCLRGAGIHVSMSVDWIGCSLPAPWRILMCGEPEIRRLSADPHSALEQLLSYSLIESLGISHRIPWLYNGLTSVVAHGDARENLARLNRHMLSASASGRMLDAEKLFAPLPRLAINLKLPAPDDIGIFAKACARQSQYWSVLEFICGSGSTPERRLAFQRFLQDPRRRKRQDEAMVVHFACSPHQLLADWRQWVLACGVGEHAPPPAEYAKILLGGPITTVKSEQASHAERSRAIRRLGREGFALGADALIEVLRQGPNDLAPEAIWALETISGRSLGDDVAQWEVWRVSLPEAATSPAVGSESI